MTKANAVSAANETDQQPHPVWCDPDLCTWTENGGAHHSVWAMIDPLGASGLAVRAYLFATNPADAPLMMIAFHSPVDNPEDIAHNAGAVEDTAACIVLPPDQVLQVNGLLSMLVAASMGVTPVQVAASAPR
jgi:hypothetical protein